MLLDQLRINDKYSYDDFEASLKERTVSEPKKKTIKDTVAYSNKTYDFSAINGEVYWEERVLEYVFEIIADTPEELEEKKRKFLAWIMFIQNEDLYDPYIMNYHFKATYDSIKVDDSEIEKSTITVTFTAYPYMIANTETLYTIAVDIGEERTVTLINNSVHKIIPKITATAPAVIKKGDSSYSVSAGTFQDESFEFEAGDNVLIITNSGTEKSTLTVTFNTEVM